MTIWRPDPSSLTRPAYLSLAEQFARAIEAGTLPASSRLSPHRRLADELGISVQTVSRAYEELTRRGLVSGEVGRGSFVLAAGAEARQPYLPDRSGELIDLSILKPICDLRHLDKMREGFAWLAENLSAPAALSFRPNIVMPRHRIVAAEWLARCGIAADPADICITNGATPAITVAMMSVAPPGSAVAAEALTHHTLMPLCGYLGVQLEGIPMDEEGMLPEALEESAQRVKLRAIYLQPNVINPIASLMTEERRRAIVEVARRHDFAIIENDVLNLLVENRPASFVALAPDRTLHINGFTKITMPGLRAAYLVSPPRFSTAVANRHLVADWMATPAIVELLSHWIADGTVDELIEWQRAALGERHRIASQVLDGLPYRSHPQSLHLWLSLPDGRGEDEFVAQARLRGVAVAAGSAFRSTKKGLGNAVRIALGATGTDDLRRGLTLVATLLEEGVEVPLPTP